MRIRSFMAVGSQVVAHDGDAVLRSHVLNAAAQPDEGGRWRVRKLRRAHKIDGLVSVVIAHSRVARESVHSRVPLVTWV
jgi:phage terminase large subunit-like protein